jgi:hypothetical protein
VGEMSIKTNAIWILTHQFEWRYMSMADVFGPLSSIGNFLFLDRDLLNLAVRCI